MKRANILLILLPTLAFVLLASACGTAGTTTNADGSGGPTSAVPERRGDAAVPDLSGHFEAPDSVGTGEQLEGVLVIVNRTGRTVRTTQSCFHKWRAVLTDGTHTSNQSITMGACPQEERRLPPGETRIPFAVDVAFGGCSGDGSGGVPKCLVDGTHMPPLPAGPYRLEPAWQPFELEIPIAPSAVQVTP